MNAHTFLTSRTHTRMYILTQLVEAEGISILMMELLIRHSVSHFCDSNQYGSKSAILLLL